MRSIAATVSSPGGSFQYTYGGSSGQPLAGINQHDPAFNADADHAQRQFFVCDEPWVQFVPGVDQRERAEWGFLVDDV
jgi:tRNA U34 2-thiouridine synthase MnmA/TrmU